MNSHTISYWNMTGEQSRYPALTESISADALIIGGGITGVTCAYCLARKGLKPVLVEAGALADGTTGNTTGKVTIQHDIIYSKIHAKYGLEAAKAYADSQRAALDFVRAAVERESIPCQLTQTTAYLYGVNDQEWDTLQKEFDLARQIGIDAELLGRQPFPPDCRGMLAFPNQAVFHPVRYVAGLAQAAVQQGAQIYCGTKAVKLEDGEVKTVFLEHGLTVKARHVIMATQYPFYDGLNLFFARLYPKRAYGMAVRSARDWPEGSYINVGDPTRSIRTHVENGERILIVVGDSHDTGRGEEDMSLHYEHLADFAREIAGEHEILAKWSAQDYETPDELPYIGRLSHDSQVYVAAGFRKWGLTSGTLSGIMTADLVAAGHCQFEDLYSLARPDISSSIGKAFFGAVNPVVELIKSKLEGVQEVEGLAPGEGRVIRFGGEKAGIYMGEDGGVTILDITCTHMGTELNFNSAEKTWDCPAHGGRFSTDGALLEGPPKNPLRVLYQGSYKDLL